MYHKYPSESFMIYPPDGSMGDAAMDGAENDDDDSTRRVTREIGGYDSHPTEIGENTYFFVSRHLTYTRSSLAGVTSTTVNVPQE